MDDKKKLNKNKIIKNRESCLMLLFDCFII